MMITDLHIRNFKGLKDHKLEKIGRMALIVGGNSTGKSSILEAIFLLFNSPNVHIFARLNDFRGRNQIGNTYDLWGSLIGRGADGFQISAWLDDGASVELSALERAGQDSFELSMPISGARLAPNGATTLNYFLKQGEASLAGYFYTAGNSVHHHRDSEIELRTATEVRIVPTSRRLNFPVLLTDVELQGRKDRLLQAMQMIDPTIEDVMLLQVDGREPEVFVRNQHGVALLMYAGTGLRNIAAMAMQVLGGDGRIVLIDQIEDALHYQMYPKIWEYLARAAHEFDGQIIAETHSIEFVGMAMKVMDSLEEMRNDLTLYRLNRELRPDEPRRKGMRRRVVRYSREDVPDSFAFGMEVR